MVVVVGGGDSAGVHIYIRPWEASAQQSVSRFGLAVRLVSSTEDLGSIPLGLSSPFRSCGLCDFVPHN